MAGDLAKGLSGESEVQIEFVRENGQKRKIPVWFTLQGRTLELLPMYGLKTKWFRAVESTGRLGVMGKGTSVSASPEVLRDPKEVGAIKRRFAAKYGEKDVKRYYPTSEVALKILI